MPGSARYEKGTSERLAKDISNLMLMCDEHHRKIDVHEKDQHPAPRLIQMKQDNERRIELLTSLMPSQQTHLILFGANIGTHQTPLTFNDASLALLPDRFPSENHAIELGITNGTLENHQPEYWDFHQQQLVRMFERRVEPLKGADKVQHYSIFAMAPMPLLIKLGSLISDIYPADVYQRHREPASWQWQSGDRGEQMRLIEPADFEGIPVLNLSLSATVTPDRIEQVLGSKVSIWTITHQEPNNDFLKTKRLLADFRILMRQAFDRIKATHGQNKQLHIFPAMPIATAIELGRIRQPKADMQLVIYDQNNKLKSFIKTIEIE
ncbi:SAVED domain-containing protein [Xanthocytophaga flavus]